MVRIVSIMLAVVLGLGAAVLVATGSTVTYAGESRRCGGPIVSAESSGLDSSDAAAAPGSDEAVARELDRLCERRERWQLAGAGLAVLLAAVAVGFARTGREDAEAPDEPRVDASV